jgi:hypothetical protein
MPARRDNWPNLLVQFIEQRREQPFAWGSNDCCTFAADWVQLCTGEDHAKTWRNRYSSGLGAARFLEEAGGVEALVDALGMQRIEPQLAGRGDIVAQETGRGMTLGICLGETTAFVAKGGLVFGPILNVETAWRI